MRLQFAAENERERICRKIDRLWDKAAPLLNKPERSEWLALAGELDPRLDVEMLEQPEATTTVVVTPRAERRLRPLAELFASRAPRSARTRVLSRAPPRALSDAIEVVLREHGHDLRGARARAGFSRGHLLEIVLYAKPFGKLAAESALATAERAIEALLGERVLDTWVGRISAEPLVGGGPLRVVNRDGASTFPLGELSSAVERAIDAVRKDLPSFARAGALRDGWAFFEAKPEPADDYAAQDDIAVATSAMPEMLKCFLEGAPFSSERFAAGGEIFAYLKIDASDAALETRLRNRTSLEDRLSSVLAERELGAVVGNGFGLRYVYVDLALAEHPDSIAAVIETARRAGVPERSWILFCDGDYADEWLPVWPGTPAPAGLA